MAFQTSWKNILESEKKDFFFIEENHPPTEIPPPKFFRSEIFTKWVLPTEGLEWRGPASFHHGDAALAHGWRS